MAETRITDHLFLPGEDPHYCGFNRGDGPACQYDERAHDAAAQMSVREFQLALLDALGLKGHWVTKLEFETDAHSGMVTLRTEEVIREDRFATLHRLFTMTQWTPDLKADKQDGV